jgi:hypothetical protein
MLRMWDTVGRCVLVRRQGHRVCRRAAVYGRRKTCQVDRPTRVEGSSPVAAEVIRLLCREGGDQADSSVRGQSVRCTHPQRDGLRIPPDDGRTATVGGDVSRLGRAGESAVVVERSQPLRVLSVKPMVPGGYLRHGGVSSVALQRVHFAVAFPYRPIGEHPVARRKFLETQMLEDWGDGCARLFKPPFDILPLVLKKLEDDRARGVLSHHSGPPSPGTGDCSYWPRGCTAWVSG